MIEAFLVLKILTCIGSVMLASALVSRDPGLRVTRRVAMIPVCTAWWSFCEIVWALQPAPEAVALWVGASSSGWMMLGAFALHAFVEIADEAEARLARRLLPAAYVLGVASVGIYALTPWGLVGVYMTHWGWSFHFGPLFALLYLATVWPIAFVLASWGMVLPSGGSRGERKVWVSIYVAVVIGFTIASLTDALLPLVGIPVITLGSTSIVLVCIGVALQFHRYGYSLLAPGAFASEILDTLGDGVVLLRGDGRIHTTNAALDALAGASAGELRGVELAWLVRGIPRDPSRITEPLESELVTTSGDRIPIQIVPARVDGGARMGGAGGLVIRDLREVRALRDRLAASGRLVVVGEIAESLSEEIMLPTDELRSDLEGIRSGESAVRELIEACEALADVEELVQERQELVEECLEGVGRIEKILSELKGFSREREGAREIADLAGLARNALRVARVRAGAGVRVRSSLDREALVSCAPDEITQVIVNLLVNAFHAVGGRGNVSLRCVQRDGHARLTVEDDGQGIAADVIERIFDPFYTTKPVGEGTGLGLAISQHIVRRHGGELLVETWPGEGASFSLLLPALSANERPMPPGAEDVQGVASR